MREHEIVRAGVFSAFAAILCLSHSFPALSGPAATMRTMVGRRVVMYSRSTCHLCDEARAVIEAERDRTPFDFEERCIDGEHVRLHPPETPRPA